MINIFNPKTASRRSGFTIIELMLVVSVLGILSTIAINSFNRQIKSARLKQAAQEFASFVRMSKSMSLSYASPCVLLVNHEKAQITISNPIECAKKGVLNLSNDLQNLVICGTSNTSNFNLLCDQENDGSDIDMNGKPKISTRIEFTSKGTVPQGALVKLYSPDIQEGHCIIVTAPVGLIRNTRMSNNSCKFTD